MKIAVDNINSWIFVTGVPRSGTTFVGKILSLPLSVDFINEPFSAGNVAPEKEFRYRYLRPDESSTIANSYHGAFERLIQYDFHLETWYSNDDSWYRRILKYILGSRGPFYLRLAKLNPFHRAAVIKEPQHALITEFLSQRFSIRPVIVVKHPVSMAASLKRLGWSPRLDWFASQPSLVEDYFADEPDFVEHAPDNIVEAAAKHWRVIYKVLLEQAKFHPDWTVVVLEELSKTPIESSRRLYEQLNLPWSASVEQQICKYTRADSAEARDNRVHDLKRDSANIFKLRRQSIPPKERERILNIVHDVALQVYPIESFGLEETDQA